MAPGHTAALGHCSRRQGSGFARSLDSTALVASCCLLSTRTVLNMYRWNGVFRVQACTMSTAMVRGWQIICSLLVPDRRMLTAYWTPGINGTWAVRRRMIWHVERSTMLPTEMPWVVVTSTVSITDYVCMWHRRLKIRTDGGYARVRELGSINLFVVTSLKMN